MSTMSNMAFPYQMFDPTTIFFPKPQVQVQASSRAVPEVDENTVLTPCSSIITIDNPVEYNPVEFNKLYTRRNSLYKSGTLTDELSVGDTSYQGPELVSTLTPARSSSISRTSTRVAAEDVCIRLLLSNGEASNIKLTDLLSFVNTHLSSPIQFAELSMTHLAIYCCKTMAKQISGIKLCHLGKCYSIQNQQDLTKKKCELLSLKVDKYPTIHITFSEEVHDSFNMDIKSMIRKTFEVEFYPVTYADVIVKKISSSNVKSKLKIRSKLKSLFK